MKLIYILIWFLLSLITVYAGYYYEIDMRYENGNIDYNKVDIIKGDFILDNKGLYFANIVSFDNRILDKTFFSIPNTIFYDLTFENASEGGVIILNKTDFTINLPYYENAKEIRIFKYNVTTNKYDGILVIDVSYYSKDVPEDYQIKKKQENVTEAIKEEKEKEKVYKNLIIYGFIVFVVLLMIVILFKLRKHK